MEITMDQIKELRESTGVSVMQCKKALEEADGNMEKALMVLRKKSGDAAIKKGDRDASDGAIIVKKDGSKAVLLVLNCETDFVAKNSDFTDLADTLANIALSEGVDSLSAKAPELINPVIQKVGENIKLGDVIVEEGGVLGSYVHSGKTAVIVKLSAGEESLARDIAMHVAAMKPLYISKDEIPAEALAMATELFKKEVDESDKPEEIKQKMLDGKLATYFKEQTLLDQAFIKNPEQTIGTLIGSSKIEKVIVKHIG